MKKMFAVLLLAAVASLAGCTYEPVSNGPSGSIAERYRPRRPAPATIYTVRTIYSSPYSQVIAVEEQ